MKWMYNLKVQWRLFARRRDGVVNIEMALVAIFLATLAVGAFDFGRVGIIKTAVTNAARAGAQYGITDLSAANDTAGMQAAALADVNDASLGLTATASTYCQCAGVSTTIDCDDSCSDGAYAPMYVEVTVEGGAALFFSYPGVPDPIPISSTSVMRVR